MTITPVRHHARILLTTTAAVAALTAMPGTALASSTGLQPQGGLSKQCSGRDTEPPRGGWVVDDPCTGRGHNLEMCSTGDGTTDDCEHVHGRHHDENDD
jgi:hypothetical protein